jgi:hypothetical protein
MLHYNTFYFHFFKKKINGKLDWKWQQLSVPPVIDSVIAGYITESP